MQLYFPFMDTAHERVHPIKASVFEDHLKTLKRQYLDLYGWKTIRLTTLIEYREFLVLICDAVDTDLLVGYMFAKITPDTVTIYEMEIFDEYRGEGYGRDTLEMLDAGYMRNKQLLVENVFDSSIDFWLKFTDENNIRYIKDI